MGEGRLLAIERYLANLLASGIPVDKIEAARRRMMAYHMATTVTSTMTSAGTSPMSTDSTPMYSTSTVAYDPSTTAYSTSTAAYNSSTATYGTSTAVYNSSTAVYSTSTSAYSTTSTAATSEVSTTLESTPFVEYIGHILDDVTTEIGERVTELGKVIAENVTSLVQATEEATTLVTGKLNLSTVHGVLPQAEDYSNSTVVLRETSTSKVVSDYPTQITDVQTYQPNSCTDSSTSSNFFEQLKDLVQYWSSNWNFLGGANTTEYDGPIADLQPAAVKEVGLELQSTSGPTSQLQSEDLPLLITIFLQGLTLAGMCC